MVQSKDKQNIYQRPGLENKTTYNKKGITKSTNALEVKNKTQEKGWYIFVDSYLRLAEIGCKQLQSKESKFTTNKKYIIISIVYNLKHSLEIILKAFARTLAKDTDKSDQIHNTKRLFKEFKKRITKKNKKLNTQVNNLEKIITKYTELDFLNKYLNGCFAINDIENKFLKYPEDSAEIIVDYEKLLSQTTREDVGKIEVDIKKLIKIIPTIKGLIK